MKQYKNIFLVAILILFIMSSLYILKLQINKDIVNAINDLESQYAIKYEKLDKKVSVIELNINGNVLGKILDKGYLSKSDNKVVKSSKNKVITKKVQNYNKILIEAMSTGNNKLCDTLTLKKEQLLCNNSFYYAKALQNVDKKICFKIIDKPNDLGNCIKKIETLNN